MPRILIVEDEPAISFGLELDLKTEGYDVEIVEDGESRWIDYNGGIRQGMDRADMTWAHENR